MKKRVVRKHNVKEHGQCQKGRNAGSNRERAGKAWNTRVFEG